MRHYRRGKHPNSRKGSPFVSGHTINVGRVCSEETKKKISDKRMEEWALGKRRGGWKISEETKKKISLANKGRRHLSQTLDKHYNWQGGISKKKGYKSFIQKRRECRKRMNGGEFSFSQWESLKQKLFFTCQSCRKQEPEIKLTVDHIIPISKGGSDDITNIQPLCLSCNCRKKDKILNYV